MTVSDANHWTKEYELLQKAFEELKKSTVNNQTTIPSIHSKINSQTVNATVIHKAITTVLPNENLNITAKIKSASGIASVKVLFRGLTQFQDYKTIEMKKDGDNFSAEIPAEILNDVIEYKAETGALWDFMYLIEVIENNGNGSIYPNFETTDPYIIAAVPHKTIQETKGKKALSKIADVTYTKNNDLGIFRILSPSNGDVYPEGATVTVKIHSPQVDPNEKVEIFNGKEKLEAVEIKKNEFVIRDLKNGAYRINAHIHSKGLVTWAEVIEIVIGDRSKK